MLLNSRGSCHPYSMKNSGQSHGRTSRRKRDDAAARAHFERLKREEQELRDGITDFKGSDNLPRDEFYQRGVNDPTRLREE